MVWNAPTMGAATSDMANMRMSSTATPLSGSTSKEAVGRASPAEPPVGPPLFDSDRCETPASGNAARKAARAWASVVAPARPSSSWAKNRCQLGRSKAAGS